MAIFNSYVKLPEGMTRASGFWWRFFVHRWNRWTILLVSEGDAQTCLNSACLKPLQVGEVGG